MEARVQKCEVYIWQCKYLCNQWLGVKASKSYSDAKRKESYKCYILATSH